MRLFNEITLYFVIMIMGSGVAHAGPLQILVYGDSFVSGYGLREEDAFTAQLQEALHGAGLDVVLINAGVAGNTTQAALARVDQTLSIPHDVVIVEFGANDMLRGIDPDITKQNLAQLVEAIDVPVFILGIRSIPTYGELYVKQFNEIYPNLAEEYKTGYYPFIMEAVFDQGAENIWHYMQRDMLHLNADGVELVVDDLSPELILWLAEVKNEK